MDNFVSVQYQSCIEYTDHYDLLSWVRDENNHDDGPPEISETQDYNQFWETGGKLYISPGDAVYMAGGNPRKVKRCYIVTENAHVGHFNVMYPPNWLDRPADFGV